MTALRDSVERDVVTSSTDLVLQSLSVNVTEVLPVPNISRNDMEY